MLDAKEKDYLEMMLAPNLQGVGAFQWLRLKVADQVFLSQFPNLLTAELLATEAIRRAVENGQKTVPLWAWLLDLVEAATNDGIIVDPILDPVRIRIMSARTAVANITSGVATNLFLTMKLYADAPFLDRELCREKFLSLHSPTGKTVMVIKGKGKVGKSYTAELIDYVSGMEQAQPFSLIRFDLSGNAILDAGDLEETIISRVGESRRPRPVEAASHDAFLNSLGRWLCGCLEDSKQMWWLVFDSFNERTASADAMKIARFMVPAPLQNPYRKYLRVVLIDSPSLAAAIPKQGELPHPYAAEEELSIPNLDESHFREYFESILYRSGVAPNPDKLKKCYNAAFQGWQARSGSADCLISLPQILQEAHR